MLLPLLWQCFKSIKLIVEKCAGYCAFETQSGSLAFKGTFHFGRMCAQFWKAAENSGYRLKIT